MTGNSGILTDRCDPYGAESRVNLLGGIYPENHVGRIMWHCDNRAAARYRMECTGGDYGTRKAPDGGIVAAHHCDGGHRGQVMPLCLDHRREIAKRQAEVCPRCLYPDSARPIFAQLEEVQRMLTQLQSLPFLPFKDIARLTSQSDQLMAAGDELIARGVVHKCPLRLVEVS